MWKQIKDYDYEVSNEGDVRNKEGRILKPSENKSGYLRVGLCKQGETKAYYIHRLVLIAFKENPLQLPIAEHKDCDRQNNNIDNLRWSTYSQNRQNTKKKENTSSKYKGVYWNKPTNKWHAQISINGKNTHLGLFDNEEDAHRVRKEKVKEIYGEFIHDCEL